MSESQSAQPGPQCGPRTAQYPAEVLIELIITLLTPIFLSAAGGDLAFARAGATETLCSYRAETQADLITVTKIIAFGLATIDSLSLSMADDLPISTILRLRSSANASDRAEHRNRLALKQNASPRQPETEMPEPEMPEPEINQAALMAAAAEMQQRTADNLARFSPPAERPTPAPPSPANADQPHNVKWAASADQIASETADSRSSLPPEQRRATAVWANLPNEAAKEFMDGNVGPHPKPDDLAAIMRNPLGM